MILITDNGRPLAGPLQASPAAQKETAPSCEQGAAQRSTDSVPTGDRIISQQSLPADKAFATVRARLALVGHTLTVSEHRSGLTLWEIARGGQVRVFSDWQDAIDHLRRLGG